MHGECTRSCQPTLLSQLWPPKKWHPAYRHMEKKQVPECGDNMPSSVSVNKGRATGRRIYVEYDIHAAALDILGGMDQRLRSKLGQEMSLQLELLQGRDSITLTLDRANVDWPCARLVLHLEH